MATGNFNKHLTTLKNRYEGMKKRHSGVIKKTKEGVQEVVGGMEAGGSAFLAGIARGRLGDDDGSLNVKGVPVMLAGGLFLKTIALTGVLGSASRHLSRVSDGMISEEAGAAGRRIGEDWKRGEKKTAGNDRLAGRTNAGNLPAGQPQTMGAMQADPAVAAQVRRQP